MLIAAAEVVRAATRPRDLLVRWGGEEFLAILPETTDVEAVEIAERVRRALAEARPHGHAVTATFGVAGYLDDEPIKDLLARADDALYEGKRNGRNQVVLARGEAAAANDGRAAAGDDRAAAGDGQHRPDVA